MIGRCDGCRTWTEDGTDVEEQFLCPSCVEEFYGENMAKNCQQCGAIQSVTNRECEICYGSVVLLEVG